MIKVKELIEILKETDPEANILSYSISGVRRDWEEIKKAQQANA